MNSFFFALGKSLTFTQNIFLTDGLLRCIVKLIFTNCLITQYQISIFRKTQSYPIDNHRIEFGIENTHWCLFCEKRLKLNIRIKTLIHIDR